ncbi:flagellar basal body protein [Yunchengibacter salinarum]|uniref:flagellar basal body protein n=1 Tax=Yunchengibacter salinarum TaxID=3133399 RepID=UPI0035B636B4
MSMQDLSVMSALKERMIWLTANQQTIAENVANADTPGYHAKEMPGQSFGGMVEKLASRTDDAGRPASSAGARGAAGAGGRDQRVPEAREADTEVTPDGNAVVLEDEMIKLADNQMNYGMVANLYKKNRDILSAALGRA